MANGANGCANISNECVNDANRCANECANGSLALSLAQMGDGVMVERSHGFDPQGCFQCLSFSIRLVSGTQTNALWVWVPETILDHLSGNLAKPC